MEQRLAEIIAESRGAPVVHSPPVPRLEPKAPAAAPVLSRNETIDRIGHMYVRRVRRTAPPEATWFDVAETYAQGWKDSEQVRR